MLLIAGLASMTACADTKQARTVERLGFLKDLYPKMIEGDEDAGESLLIYRNPRVAQIPANTYKSSCSIRCLSFVAHIQKWRVFLRNKHSSWPIRFMH